MSAEGLTRLAYDEDLVVNNTIFAIQAIDDKDSHMFSLEIFCFRPKQLTNKLLQRKHKDPNLAEYFRWMQFDNVEVIFFKEKVWVPEDLQLWLIEWYHKTW